MRWNDLNDGSIKTLLILGLLAANIVLTGSRRDEPGPVPQAASAPPALFAASPSSPLYAARVPRGAGETADETPALPAFHSP
jgi:hypothetical protein